MGGELWMELFHYKFVCHAVDAIKVHAVRIGLDVDSDALSIRIECAAFDESTVNAEYLQFSVVGIAFDSVWYSNPPTGRVWISGLEVDKRLVVFNAYLNGVGRRCDADDDKVL